MRSHVLVLAVLLATGAVAGAQNRPATGGGAAAASQGGTATQQQPPAAAANPAASAAALDQHLAAWEREMKKVQTLTAVLNRIDKDKSFGTTSRFSGHAKYMKAGNGTNAMNLGLLELRPEARKNEIAEKIVCTGTYLYQWAVAQKEIRRYEVPRSNNNQLGEDSFLSLMFGMKADEAKRRYVLKMAREDQWYVYVDVVPRFAADKADFARARLVLHRSTYMPRQLWFEHANGNEVTWDVPRIDTRTPIERRAFDAPQAPAGWKIVPVNTKASGGPGGSSADNGNVKPRVIRPSGK